MLSKEQTNRNTTPLFQRNWPQNHGSCPLLFCWGGSLFLELVHLDRRNVRANAGAPRGLGHAKMCKVFVSKWVSWLEHPMFLRGRWQRGHSGNSSLSSQQKDQPGSRFEARSSTASTLQLFFSTVPRGFSDMGNKQLSWDGGSDIEQRHFFEVVVGQNQWDPILGQVNSPPILEPILLVGLGCSTQDWDVPPILEPILVVGLNRMFTG